MQSSQHRVRTIILGSLVQINVVDNYACDAFAANIYHGLGAPHMGDTCTYDFVYVKCTVQVSPKVQQMQEDVESRYSGFEQYSQETLWKLGCWAQLA